MTTQPLYVYAQAGVNDEFGHPLSVYGEVAPYLGQQAWGSWMFSASYGPAETEAVVSNSVSSGEFTGQTFTVTPNRSVVVDSIYWRGHWADTYRLTVDGVRYGNDLVIAADNAWGTFDDIGCVLLSGTQYTFSIKPVDLSENEYYFRSTNGFTTATFVFGHWQEAGGGEAVPFEITFREIL